uniref:hypothetical protein n=1 Tax=Candidatus Electronema sp. TaxID=2698783 RepID=UPI0040570192
MEEVYKHWLRIQQLFLLLLKKTASASTLFAQRGLLFSLERRFAVLADFSNCLLSRIHRNKNMRLQDSSALLEEKISRGWVWRNKSAPMAGKVSLSRICRLPAQRIGD